MKNRFMSRVNSDSAESLTISQILWIVFTVVLVLAVGTLLLNAIRSKGRKIAECINQSTTLFHDAKDKTCR